MKLIRFNKRGITISSQRLKVAAQVVLFDEFDYAPGNLDGNGGWIADVFPEPSWVIPVGSGKVKPGDFASRSIHPLTFNNPLNGFTYKLVFTLPIGATKSVVVLTELLDETTLPGLGFLDWDATSNTLTSGDTELFSNTITLTPGSTNTLLGIWLTNGVYSVSINGTSMGSAVRDFSLPNPRFNLYTEPNDPANGILIESVSIISP